MNLEIAVLIAYFALLAVIASALVYIRLGAIRRKRVRAKFDGLFDSFTESAWPMLEWQGTNGDGSEVKGCTKEQLRYVLETAFGKACVPESDRC